MSSGINCREIFVFLDILIWNQTKRRNRQNNDNNNNNNNNNNINKFNQKRGNACNTNAIKPNKQNNSNNKVKVIKCKNTKANQQKNFTTTTTAAAIATTAIRHNNNIILNKNCKSKTNVNVNNQVSSKGCETDKNAFHQKHLKLLENQIRNFSEI
ncbi:myb-like protein A [Glossina fuscipes]|uniref:Myb-like protein A n=1 Tax=Glossina fuscipes TaxID=7396 RepID=A0A9C5Z8U7_9MUSC|nr:myb-like protein A [Glossina fuscipes]XP_037895135.1 myb-like protein A [Glossina fuscipes]XP_037895136.1 myb-like protein A [Glossina fuscipes]XP_037895137.1 myb-like protein A [Glossina fuscipes]XP_037895138.1 myb-like protein A [Glossina fuscipes]